MIKAVVMAGGLGTCLWPLSRAVHPKQFSVLHGEDTMLQASLSGWMGANENLSLPEELY